MRRLLGLHPAYNVACELVYIVVCTVRRNQMASKRCDGISLRVTWKVGLIHVPIPHTRIHTLIHTLAISIHIFYGFLVHVWRTIHKFDKIIFYTWMFTRYTRLIHGIMYQFSYLQATTEATEIIIKYQRNQFIINSNECIYILPIQMLCLCKHRSHNITLTALTHF